MSVLERLYATRGRNSHASKSLELELLEPRMLLSGLPGTEHLFTEALAGGDALAANLGPDPAEPASSLEYVDSGSASGSQVMLPDAFVRPLETGLDAKDSPPPTGLRPYGATFEDPSEFMIGDIWVTVVLLESNGSIDTQTENWTAGEITSVEAEITEGLTWWETTFQSYPAVSPLHDLDFHIDFTYAASPVPTGYEPIRHPQSDESLWINDFLDFVGYNTASSIWTDLAYWNDDQRTANDAHWAYTVFVVDSSADADGMFTDGYFAYAYLGGPFAVMTYDNNGWGIGNMGQVLAHETGHIFYALDEYPGSDFYTDRSGYYNTQNLNAYDWNPSPGSRVSSIMAEASLQDIAYAAHVTSPTSAYMIGWQDSDADGIFDVLDVPLSLSGSGSYDVGSGQYTFTGSSSVQVLNNLNPWGYGHDITTNTVDRIQYNLDGAGWVDGNAYGQYVTSVGQDVPCMVLGSHTIEFRTIFSETGVTSDIWSDSFEVPSTVTLVNLQAAGDSGISATDHITNDSTPTYDVTLSAAGTIEIDWENDGVIDVTDVVGDAGTYQYTPGSALSDGLYPVYVTFTAPGEDAVVDTDPTTIDTAAPSVPGAPDLHATSDTGIDDNNVTAIRTPAFDVVVPAGLYFRLYRDGGLVSEAPIVGDDAGIYKTGTSEQLSEQPLGAFDYTATLVDAAGNESAHSAPLEVQFTSLWPVAWREYADGVFVVIYDTDASNGVTAPNVAWHPVVFQPGVTDILVDPGKMGDAIINSVQLFGDGTNSAGLGIVVENNAGLSNVLDSRQGTPPLELLVSEGPIGKIKLPAGIEGTDINGFTTEGGWRFDPDIDGDGDTSDLTAICSPGAVGSVMLGHDVSADIWIGGTGAKGLSLKSFSIRSGGYHGDLVALGDVGKIAFGGDFGSSITIWGSLKTLDIKGGDLNGDVYVAGLLGKISVTAQRDKLTRLYEGGDFLGTLETTGGVRNMSVTGSVRNASIQVGGLMKSLSVGEDFYNSSIYAGALSKVKVKGVISEDDSDGDVDEVHADGGSFSIADATWMGILDITHDHWFDGVRAWVG